MRVFVAIEFEDELKEYFLTVQNSVMRSSRRGNFTDKNNFHLTLNFVGEVESDEINSLVLAIEEIATRTKRFQLELSHLGFFPKGNRSIVWIGTKESVQISKLFQGLQRTLQKQGFARERGGLKPHITIGREIDLKEKFDVIKDANPIDSNKKINVTTISLMESKRVGAKLVYVPLFTSKLR